MRLVFDLFPCQTGSRFRGIGRFTQSLAEAMARSRGEHDLYTLANGLYPESMDALRQDISPLLPPGHFAAYTHTISNSFANGGTIHTAVATALVLRAYQALAPDVVLYASPFEGWNEQGVVPLPQGSLPTALRVAVLYDFIPWLFPDQHLENAPNYKEWYKRRVAELHKFDLLLAISEATRRDAIDILGIPPERVVNISGAASSLFRPMAKSEHAGSTIAQHGIVRPFVLYTGNADYRKNLDGMLQAYARLPAALRKMHQLVLNQVGDMAAFRSKTRALGLTADDVVVTGHVTDTALRCLYNQCKVFVFPSLYEGFGLPVLEAMACGAPVIAANNSSIPEVVGRNDVLFDATDPAAIAIALQNVLTNDSWRRELADYSIERAKLFSWDSTGKLAWQAIETSLDAKYVTPLQDCLQRLPRSRIAIVCALPPQDTPAARHCCALLPLLGRYFEIDLFVEEGMQVDAPLLQAAFAIYPHTQLATRYDRYATVVFHVANSACHAYILPLMEQFTGIVVLHDVQLDVPVKVLAGRPGMEHVLRNEILYAHGLQGLITYLERDELPSSLSLNRHVLESAQQLILPNPSHADLLAQAGTGAWLPPMTLLTESDTASCVGDYVLAIHAAIGNAELHTVKHLADALENIAPNENVLHAIAYHATDNWGLRKQPRILLDVTQLAKVDARSGIQRVVRNIANEIGRYTELKRPVELVRQENGKLWRASRVISSIFGIDTQKIPEQEVLIQPGDTLLMIDSSWEQYGDFLPIFQSVRRLGGKIVTVVYDLIPLLMSEKCSPGLVAVFNRWFNLAAEQSDMLLCISRSVADEVTAYLAEHKLKSARNLCISYWPLGADISVSNQEASIRQQVHQIAEDKQSPLFLMVGTIEPRKGHDFVLDAFDDIWQSGADIRLCIAGTVGWMVPDTVRRIRNHTQLNKKLFFIEKFTDAEINLCYATATALIAASVAEGFGLPIVEAALHQVPVLASDIPVFREVGRDGAKYFSLSSPRYLSEAIRAFADLSTEDRFMMACKITTITWQESAKNLLSAIGCE